ncbi:MAG: hypothetical protein Q4A39_01930, partial [Eubacteriales bacterium]|nr:hypothetical protein [Eubacteriales bacterium]
MPENRRRINSPGREIFPTGAFVLRRLYTWDQKGQRKLCIGFAAVFFRAAVLVGLGLVVFIQFVF